MKRVLKFLPGSALLALCVFSLVNTAASAAATTLEPHPEYNWFDGVSITIKYQYVVSSPGLTFSSTENNTLTLELDSSAVAAEDLTCDVINSSTKYYSPSFAGKMSSGTTPASVTGIWQNLMFLSENGFSSYADKEDSDLIAFYQPESIDAVLTRALKGVNSAYTYQNATILDIYATLSVKKTKFDTFAQAVASDEDYSEIAEKYSTDQTKLTTLFDSYFKDYLRSITFMTVNVTGYNSGWTVADELENVTTTTDNSIDGLKSLYEIRNALTGYISLVQAPDDVIGGTTPASVPNEHFGKFIGIEVTDENYNVKVGLLSDFTQNNIITKGLTLALTQLFPHIVTGSGKVVFPLWADFVVPAIMILAGYGIYTMVKTFRGKRIKIKDPKKTAVYLLITYAVLVLMMILVYGFYT